MPEPQDPPAWEAHEDDALELFRKIVQEDGIPGSAGTDEDCAAVYRLAHALAAERRKGREEENRAWAHRVREALAWTERAGHPEYPLAAYHDLPDDTVVATERNGLVLTAGDVRAVQSLLADARAIGARRDENDDG